MKTFAKLTLMGAILPLLAGAASAQDFYDDDIYGSSAARKAAAKKQQRTAAQAAVTDYAPADRYAGVATSYGGSTRNVDEYNRRGSYTPVKTQTSLPDSLGGNFEYTRRLERFHNSDVVSRSNDPDVEYMYNYADDELAQSSGAVRPAEVNIYVNNVVDPWDVFSPYYYSSAWSWAFVPGYANPWWGYNYWGPTWSWSWGWGPSWSWGPGWNWGWGPSWSWGWGGGGWYPPHHHHPMPGPSWSHNGRPGAAPGAYRPANRPVGSLTQSRPSSIGRPGRASGTFSRRPSQSAASDRVSGSASSNNGGFSRRPYNPSDANRVGAISNGNNGTRRSSATGSRTTNGRTSSSWGSSSSGFNHSSGSSSSSNRSSSSGYNRSSSGSSSGFNRSSGTGGSGRSSSTGSRSTSGGSRGRR